MEALAGYREVGAEIGIAFVPDLDRIAEEAAAEERKIVVAGFGTLAPEFLHVVGRFEREISGSARRDVGGEALFAVGLAFYEIPEGHAAGRIHHGFDTIGGGVC